MSKVGLQEVLKINQKMTSVLIVAIENYDCEPLLERQTRLKMIGGLCVQLASIIGALCSSLAKATNIPTGMSN
jgi:hypothetical protein